MAQTAAKAAVPGQASTASKHNSSHTKNTKNKDCVIPAYKLPSISKGAQQLPPLKIILPTNNYPRQAHMVPVRPTSHLAEVHVIPYGWPAGGACIPLLQGSHVRREESALRPSLRLPCFLHSLFPDLFYLNMCM